MGPLAALATTRVRVRVVAMPGRALLRIRAEAEARRRGWPLVDEPEQTDLLVICGAPSRFSGDAAERLWARTAAPRARAGVASAAEVPAAFDAAVRVLRDAASSRTGRAGPPPQPGRSGVAVLGPLARGWPDGLIVTARLDAGRIVEARLRLEAVPAEDDALDAEGARAVLMLDRAGAVLRLAGWPAAALVADRLVDGVLQDAPRGPLLRRARRLRRRAAGSAALALAVRPAVRDALLDALGHAERALRGFPVDAPPLDAAAFVAPLQGCTPLEAAQWAAAAGRPGLRRAADG